MQVPKITKGGLYQDARGCLRYNNDFDLQAIKRFYIIQPASVDDQRGWQGHKIEQRWFSALKGAFKIKTIAVDDWETPSKNLPQNQYELKEGTLDTLHIPSGYITCIQATEEDAMLGVFADYGVGEINDEYRYDKDYFS